MQKSWNIDAAALSLWKENESWSGSFYELSMAYDSTSFNEQMRLQTIQWLWDDPSLLGVVHSHWDQSGPQWHEVDASFLAPYAHANGFVRFPDGQMIGCGSLSLKVNEEIISGLNEEITWLTLYIPLSMLGTIFPIHYPVARKENLWITQADKFLGTIGARVYQKAPFLFAVMGEEAAAWPLKRILADIKHSPDLLVPTALFQRQGIEPYGARLSEDLWWTGGF